MMKRFYKDVAIANVADGAWQVTLDGRPIRSQGGGQQMVPSKALAEKLAAEWRAQGEEIDPKSFILRDMADYAIDVVRAERAETITSLIAYAQTDTLCYRADPGDAIFARQEELWEPLVSACEARHSIRFARISGIIHDAQSADTVSRLEGVLHRQEDFALAGLQTLTSIAASLIVGLEALEDGADAETLFSAANAEEDWQAELWGWDEEAEKRRALRLEAFTHAHEFVRLSRPT